MPDQVTDVRLLDDGYSREVRSLFYHAYRHEPTFAYLMDAQRAGYDQRVRACVREMVERHLGEELPAIGLFIDDRLVAAALITPPQRRLDITESWNWRLRMLFSVGLAATRRYLDYHRAVQACLPVGPTTSCRCSACIPSTRAGRSASSCWRPCSAGAPRTPLRRGWSWILAMRATWTSTSGTATVRSAR